MINFLKYLGYIIASILGGMIILTIFNYFGIVNGIIFKILKIMLVIISTFIFSFFLGKRSKSRGYLEGLKLGGMLILLFLVISIILNSFKITSLIYYLIIIITSIVGSMVGINLKRNN